MDLNNQRRSFFKKAFTVTAALVVTPYLANLSGQTQLSKGKPTNGALPDNTMPFGQPQINKAFQLYCYSDGRVELRTPRKAEVKIGHLFNSGFEVDVLLLIACNRSIDENLKVIASRHSLSESACKNQVNQLMNELYTKGLIC